MVDVAGGRRSFTRVRVSWVVSLPALMDLDRSAKKIALAGCGVTVVDVVSVVTGGGGAWLGR